MNYVVQEAIVVIKDIFRKYPNKYESIIATLCENLDTLDEPEARASMIWIIGESFLGLGLDGPYFFPDLLLSISHKGVYLLFRSNI